MNSEIKVCGQLAVWTSRWNGEILLLELHRGSWAAKIAASEYAGYVPTSYLVYVCSCFNGLNFTDVGDNIGDLGPFFDLTDAKQCAIEKLVELGFIDPIDYIRSMP